MTAAEALERMREMFLQGDWNLDELGSAAVQNAYEDSIRMNLDVDQNMFDTLYRRAATEARIVLWREFAGNEAGTQQADGVEMSTTTNGTTTQTNLPPGANQAVTNTEQTGAASQVSDTATTSDTSRQASQEPTLDSGSIGTGASTRVLRHA